MFAFERLEPEYICRFLLDKRQLVTGLQSLYVFGLSNIHFLQLTGHMEHTLNPHYQ